MATANPYPDSSYGEVWEQGYNDGLNGVGGMFGTPPSDLDDDYVGKWKEGFKAGKVDAKTGVSVAPDPPPQPSQTQAPAQGGGQDSGERTWDFTVEERKFDNVSTSAAEKALAGLADGLERRIEYFEGYQVEFNKACDSHVMNFIIEAAGGGHWQPDAAIWGGLKDEVAKIRSAASGGQIIEAAEAVTKVSTDVQQAGEDWQRFLDYFQEGGNAVVEDLGHVVKASIFVEVALAEFATGGEASALIGAGDGSLNEMADQYIAVSTGKASEMDWTKVAVDGVMGAVLGAAGDAVSEKWAGLLAKAAPGLVGADTSLMESIGSKFINTATGKAFTAAEMAAELEPAWGKVITKLPVNAVKEAITTLVDSGFGEKTSDESLAEKILKTISDTTWEVVIEEAVKDSLQAT
jgi:hypothetical protein